MLIPEIDLPTIREGEAVAKTKVVVSPGRVILYDLFPALYLTTKVLFIVKCKHIAFFRLVVEGHGVIVGSGCTGRTGVQLDLTCLVTCMHSRELKSSSLRLSATRYLISCILY